MVRAGALASVAVLTLLVTGCSAEAPAASPQPVVTASTGPDAGNDRPLVSYDGLMVRRRTVLAVLPDAGVDLAELRRALDAAAARHGTALTDLPPDVLDAALLERSVPDLTVSLPGDVPTDGAAQLLDGPLAQSQAFPGMDHIEVASVLVHDLRFRVETADPDLVAEEIAREGIVSDALGNYRTDPGDTALDIVYTGPLISDVTVQSVRVGIARAAATSASAVRVLPRSSSGSGVDMAKEQDAATTNAVATDQHGHADAAPAPSGPSFSGFWVLGLAVAAAWLTALVVLVLHRMGRLELRWRRRVDPVPSGVGKPVA